MGHYRRQSFHVFCDLRIGNGFSSWVVVRNTLPTLKSNFRRFIRRAEPPPKFQGGSDGKMEIGDSRVGIETLNSHF